MIGRFRKSHHVVGAFAFAAVLLHAAFWTVCTLQLPPQLDGRSGFGAAGFLVSICTPDGARTVSDPFGEENPPPAGDGACPICVLACGVHAAPTVAAVMPPLPAAEPVVDFRLPEVRLPVQPAAFRSARPRGPPSVFPAQNI